MCVQPVGESWPTAAIPIENRYCSCRLTRVGRARYNHTTLGLMTCVEQEFSGASFSSLVQQQQFVDYHQALARQASGEVLDETTSACIQCPSECLDCLVAPLRVKVGFALPASAPLDGVPCIVEGVQVKCVSLLRCRPEEHHEGGEHQCLGGTLESRESLACAAGYQGQLCGTCSPGFGREDGNKCVDCDDANDPVQILKVACLLSLVCFAFGGIVVHMRHNAAVDQNPSSSDDKAEPLMATKQGTDGTVFGNPLNGEDLNDGTEPTNADTNQAAVSLGSVLNATFFISLQPAKIVITYLQIASMLGAVLHFKLPPIFASFLGVFKPIIAAINGVIALQCVGIDDYHVAWCVEVFVIPGFFFLAIGVYCIYELKILASALAWANFSDRCFFLLFMVSHGLQLQSLWIIPTAAIS